MTDLEYADQPTYWIRVTNHGGKATRIETFGVRPPEHGVIDDLDIGAPLSQVIASDSLAPTCFVVVGTGVDPVTLRYPERA
jgi:hypothetical protein